MRKRVGLVVLLTMLTLFMGWKIRSSGLIGKPEGADLPEDMIIEEVKTDSKKWIPCGGLGDHEDVNVKLDEAVKIAYIEGEIGKYDVRSVTGMLVSYDLRKGECVPAWIIESTPFSFGPKAPVLKVGSPTTIINAN